ncbi:kinase [Actinophytocola sediminis]
MANRAPRADPSGMGVGRASGSFGELVQGVLPDGRDFLVTLPIASWSTAVFRHAPADQEITVHPAGKRKALRLVRLALDTAGHSGGGWLELSGGLPEGKGLASSSADLVATARAVAAAVGTTFDDEAIESLLRRIEPSDGVMYDGVVAFYHREVRLHSWLGTLPPLAIVAHDEGGQVDTVDLNRVPKPFGAADRREYGRLLAGMTEAVRAGHLPEIGRIATRSALLNARLRPRPGLRTLQGVCAEVAGFGLVLAHSGTMLGILLDATDPELTVKTEFVRASCVPLGGEVSVLRTLSFDRDYALEA